MIPAIFSKNHPMVLFPGYFKFRMYEKKTPDVKFKREFIINCFLGFYLIRSGAQSAING